MGRDYDWYRSLVDKPDETEEPKSADVVDLDALLEGGLL